MITGDDSRTSGNDRGAGGADRHTAEIAPSARSAPWTRAVFEQQLREQGKAYHIHHPFNVMLNEGKATREQIQGWVANRFYYQVAIPIKDAAVMSNCPDQSVRREWVKRLLDHDGYDIDGKRDAGGIEAWLRLAEATGLTRDETTCLDHVVPGVRFAVDAYIEFARTRPWQESVCASLTELFAPAIHKQRLATWPAHYPWIDSDGLQYFRNRVTQARRDVEHGLQITLDYFASREQQARALDILNFKLDVLWQMNDAMAQRYGLPGQPPSAQRPRRADTASGADGTPAVGSGPGA